MSEIPEDAASRKLTVDLRERTVTLSGETRSFSDPQAFNWISDAWLQVGWDVKHVYSFSWLGRPIIQLPEDMVRMQEAIFRLRPDVIIETGVAHGGSMVFYASLCKAMERGRVIGVDIEIRPHNRSALETHFLKPFITLIEGSSTAPEVVSQIRDQVKPEETVMVILDSCHGREHVLAELRAYSRLVTPGSWIVATDGIMRDLVGAPRSSADWADNNPCSAVADFLQENSEFEIAQPGFEFNEGLVDRPITYWPDAWLRKKP
jgi:cephalosporin hydroxylase